MYICCAACCHIRKGVFFISLCHLRVQSGADFLADWWQKCGNVFWKQNIFFESQIMTLHFDILLSLLFLVMIFVILWQNLCLRTGGLCWNLTLSQQFVTKMKNKSEKDKWAVLFHHSDCLCATSLVFVFVLLDRAAKTYIIHRFDGQSAYQMSSQIHHDYVSFQVKRCPTFIPSSLAFIIQILDSLLPSVCDNHGSNGSEISLVI